MIAIIRNLQDFGRNRLTSINDIRQLVRKFDQIESKNCQEWVVFELLERVHESVVERTEASTKRPTHECCP